MNNIELKALRRLFSLMLLMPQHISVSAQSEHGNIGKAKAEKFQMML